MSRFTDSDDEVIEKFWAGVVKIQDKPIGLIQQEFIQSQNLLIEQLIDMLDELIVKSDQLADIQTEIIKLQQLKIEELENARIAN